MKSSSESILPVVVAGVARSDAFFLTGTSRSPEVTAVETDSRRVVVEVASSREIDEDGPVAFREGGSDPLVAEVFSLSEIAASAAFLFLVKGGVVNGFCGKPQTGCAESVRRKR